MFMLLACAILTRRALLIAAANRLHCAHRRRLLRGPPDTVPRAVEQAVKEVACNH